MTAKEYRGITQQVLAGALTATRSTHSTLFSLLFRHRIENIRIGNGFFPFRSAEPPIDNVIVPFVIEKRLKDHFHFFER
jgi:hypothetical protein